MNQGRVRGRGRGYRSSFRNEPQTSRLGQHVDTIPKPKTILHNNNCCEKISVNLELDAKGEAFFQELKNLWNMCK